MPLQQRLLKGTDRKRHIDIAASAVGGAGVQPKGRSGASAAAAAAATAAAASQAKRPQAERQPAGMLAPEKRTCEQRRPPMLKLEHKVILNPTRCTLSTDPSTGRDTES